MSPYSIHFTIALSLATIVSICLAHSVKIRYAAALIVPALFYLLFYNYNYNYVGGIFPIAVSYAGALYVLLVFLFFSSYKYAEQKCFERKKNTLKAIFLSTMQLLTILYAMLIPWAIDTFPLANVEAVLFTLFAGTQDGSENFVKHSLIEKALIPTIELFLLLNFIQIILAIAFNRKKISFVFTLWKVKYYLNAEGLTNHFLNLQKVFFILILFYCFILSILLPSIALSISFKALFQKPVDSELYRNHFIHPDSITLKLPETPKNMIVILLESMETNFGRYTPEIVKLQQENTSFLPGGTTVAGTSWTIAAITGKLCGIPLNMPMGINEHLGNLPTYLPNARCLMDLLKKLNYSQLYIQGSSGDFTQKRKFWTEHGNVDVHDLEYYKRIKRIPEDYNVFWGFEDRKLYEIAKQELDSLSKEARPFVLYMLTVDTHQPEGYVDAQCAKEYKDVEGTLPKSLHCASKMLGDFLTWAKEQSWYKNTVIAVMGDHSMPMLSAKASISSSDSLYWVNIIINSFVKAPIRERSYSSLDMFPTLLESMGFVLDKRSAGLGRSLYSDSLTMLELYGRRVLDSLLRERSIQYDKILFR